MTTKNQGKRLERVNLRLWEKDLAYLRKHYPDNYNAQIRRIVGDAVALEQRTTLVSKRK